MTPDFLFALAGQIAMTGWVLLILGPRRLPWFNLLPAFILPGVLCLLYAVLVLTRFAEGQGGFGSLSEVRLLFANDWLLLAGWIHYLAFDLMVGALLAVRLDRAGVGRLMQGAILPLVFLFGPLGAFLMLLLEAVHMSLRFGLASRLSPRAPHGELV